MPLVSDYFGIMRVDRFTKKMQEALQSAQNIASEFSHQEIGNEHFLLALLAQPDGVAVPALEARLREDLDKRSRVSGASSQAGRPALYPRSAFNGNPSRPLQGRRLHRGGGEGGQSRVQ